MSRGYNPEAEAKVSKIIDLYYRTDNPHYDGSNLLPGTPESSMYAALRGLHQEVTAYLTARRDRVPAYAERRAPLTTPSAVSPKATQGAAQHNDEPMFALGFNERTNTFHLKEVVAGAGGRGGPAGQTDSALTGAPTGANVESTYYKPKKAKRPQPPRRYSAWRGTGVAIKVEEAPQTPTPPASD